MERGKPNNATPSGPYQCPLCGAYALTHNEATGDYQCPQDAGGCDRPIGRLWVAWNQRHEVRVQGPPDPAWMPAIHRLVRQGRPVLAAAEEVYNHDAMTKDERAAVLPHLAREYDAWLAALTGLRMGYLCGKCQKDSNDEIAPGVWECVACRTRRETPAWVAKRASDGSFQDVEFGKRLVQALVHGMRAGKDPDEVLDTTMATRGIPRELRGKLWEAVADADRTEDLVVDQSKIIVFGQDGLYLNTDKRSTLVVGGRFRVVRVVTIEGERRAVVEDDMGEFAGTLDEIMARLEANVQVLSFRDAKEVLAHLIHRCPDKSTAAATYGVCEENGRLYLPKEYLPKQGEQHDALERVQEHLTRDPTPEEFQAYADFARFFLAHEWVPAYALAAVAPLAPVLRRRKQIFPLVYQYSREPGTGKSTLMEAMTRGVWNTEVESAKTLNSDYRFMAYMDMISLTWGFDEAQDFDWDKFGGSLKQAMESEYTERRGGISGKGVRMQRNRSRLSPILSANVMRSIPPAVLARVLVVHFLEERTRAPDAVKKEFKRAFTRLTVCGPAITRAALEECQHSLPVLLAQLEDLQDQIGKRYHEARDNRRLSVWALLYWGLRAWERASGGAVAAPPIAEFVETVVRPIEEAGQLATLDPLTKLRSFLTQYVARNNRGGIVAGQGELFSVSFWGDKRLHGYDISLAFLDLYNESVRASPELGIPNLKDLGSMVSRRHKIPEPELLPDQGQARRVRWGDRQVRVVFLPLDEPEPPGQTSLAGGNGHNGGGNGHGAARPAMAQGERVVWLMERLREHAKGQPEGVPVAAVLADAAPLGLEEDTVRGDLDTAAAQGYVYRPRPDHVLPY